MKVVIDSSSHLKVMMGIWTRAFQKIVALNLWDDSLNLVIFSASSCALCGNPCSIHDCERVIELIWIKIPQFHPFRSCHKHRNVSLIPRIAFSYARDYLISKPLSHVILQVASIASFVECPEHSTSLCCMTTTKFRKPTSLSLKLTNDGRNSPWYLSSLS